MQFTISGAPRRCVWLLGLRENCAKPEVEVLEDKNESNEEEEELSKSYDLSVNAEDRFVMMEQDMQFRISSLK